MRKRGWPVITVEILEAALSASSRMRIMYKSNLNFESFNRHFGDLERKGFIEEVNGAGMHRKYRTTEKGRILLDVLRKVNKIVSEEP